MLLCGRARRSPLISVSVLPKPEDTRAISTGTDRRVECLTAGMAWRGTGAQLHLLSAACW